MTEVYKLHYFNTRGAAEAVRLLFAYAGVEYEDIRIEKSEWESKKPLYPWNHLPMLEVNGNKLSQSAAIIRYLGNQFNMAGDNEFEAAKCDEMIESKVDLRHAIMTIQKATDELTRKELEAKALTETFPKFFRKWDEIITQNNGFLVGTRISYADISIAYFLENVNDYFGGTILENYPALKKHSELVLNAPGIIKWILERPKSES